MGKRSNKGARMMPQGNQVTAQGGLIFADILVLITLFTELLTIEPGPSAVIFALVGWYLTLRLCLWLFQRAAQRQEQ